MFSQSQILKEINISDFLSKTLNRDIFLIKDFILLYNIYTSIDKGNSRDFLLVYLLTTSKSQEIYNTFKELVDFTAEKLIYNY
ncbi:hypothetical protein RhiirA4_463286 [Rhizophagus irregularis]|uniref:Uncharacterized protein n=1 Tax=Rhizophagus irregularis TaxID=588596 RepID=A0A2I1GMS7_9GLOM|nr:hypothetical protein RhiirA4_463286 [Rhizophagus irregularis]